MALDTIRSGAAAGVQDIPAIRRRSHAWAVLGFVLFVCVPAGLAAGYYWGFAADRYVTELRYSIRGGPRVDGADGAAGGSGGAMALAAAADSFILEDYLRSAAVIDDLDGRVDIRAMLARDGGDPVRRFDPAASPEEVLGFWNAALGVRFDVLTGITALEVRLFRPEDSQTVARTLVILLEALVDRLSEQAQNDMLAYVDREFRAAEGRLNETLDAIEGFRRRTLSVSPTDEAELSSATIAQLTAEVTALRVRLRTLEENVPNSPQIPRLREQIASLETQIGNTRARVGGRAEEGALPGQLSDFERLQSEYQIALDSYIATLQLQQQARAAATLGRAQLVVFVPPRPAVRPTWPNRPVEVLQIAGAALLAWVIGRVLLASLRTP